jgi:hypothetical protein
MPKIDMKLKRKKNSFINFYSFVLTMWDYIILLTLAIEFITILCRKYIGSWKEFHKGKPTIHIHHLYTGFLVVFLYALFPYTLLLIIGLSMVFSDLIHHFIVLPIWIEKTEFP